MNIEIRRSFEKDAQKLPSAAQILLARVIDNLSQVEKLSELASCKKLSGFKNAYRIRMGEYRVGFIFENGTVELVRILGRKEIYKYFP